MTLDDESLWIAGWRPCAFSPKEGSIPGKMSSMELILKAVEGARRGDNVALKVEAQDAEESSLLYGPFNGFQGQLHLLCEGCIYCQNI